MKVFKYIMPIAIIALASCQKLDLNPLSDPSTGNFFSNETELNIAINDLYRIDFNNNDNEEFSDNIWNRGSLGNAVTFGTMASNNGDVSTYWTNSYKAIARTNTIIASLHRAQANTAPATLALIEAQARFARAFQYSKLIARFGDVPFHTEPITLEEAYELTRKNKDEILNFIFAELDFAAANLPNSYPVASDQRWTKGIALAVKARIALYMGKFDVARDAAKAVMDLGVYALYSDYRNLFLAGGKRSKEIVWSIPRNQALGSVIPNGTVTAVITRNAGGFASSLPTWSLMDAYECTDGLPIDKSPLYNPQKPFENRDPRLSLTIVPFSTNWLGFSYQPHPDSLKVKNHKTGAMVTNNDSRGVAQFASFTGLVLKKGVEESWATLRIAENDLYIIRYPEVLLTYAEAMIELGTIDNSVLAAINTVRARAYGKDVAQTTTYPAVSTLDQEQLRTIIRRERRVELANEGLRYMDLIRWRLAERALVGAVVGLPDPATQDRNKWPFAAAPAIDKDGIPSYQALTAYSKVLATNAFDKTRQYLWPIPADERLVNKKLTQNPGY